MSPVEPSPPCQEKGLLMGILAPALWCCCQNSQLAVSSEKDLIWTWRLCCVLSPTLACRPWGGGHCLLGGHFWLWRCCVCVRVGVPASSCSRNPASACSPGRAGPKMATRFSVAPPSSTGDPFLPGPGCWQPCQAVAGMEFPAFLVGRVASESYLLCLWHQLASWSRGHVRETRPGTRGLLLGASSWLTRSPHFGHDWL